MPLIGRVQLTEDVNFVRACCQRTSGLAGAIRNAVAGLLGGRGRAPDSWVQFKGRYVRDGGRQGPRRLSEIEPLPVSAVVCLVNFSNTV